jgi:hypothetical protein
MTDLWWEPEKPTGRRKTVVCTEYLYAGLATDEADPRFCALGFISRSNKGKWWTWHLDLPLHLNRQWGEKEFIRGEVEALVRKWFEFTQTSRPATETNHD